MTATLLQLLIGIPLGMLAENAGEWFTHRFIFHGLGKRRGSLWAYHWDDHHKVCSQNGMVDPGYRQLPLRWNTQGKEAAFLLGVALLHVPLWTFFPGYVAGMCLALSCYYYKHRRAHLDPEWARTHLPWHWEHHMGGDCDANWCVTWPWFDWLMHTSIEGG